MSIIKTLEHELACVRRNEHGQCDQKCDRCDLVLPYEEVETAYIKVITILRVCETIKELME